MSIKVDFQVKRFNRSDWVLLALKGLQVNGYS